MRFSLTSLVSLSLSSLLSFQLIAGSPGSVLVPRRASSILNDPAGQPPLPAPAAAAQAAAQASLNLNNIQGDILIGMKKKQEVFFFFSINNVKTFKQRMKVLSLTVTTTTQLLDVSKQPDAAVNVAFSQSGLTKLGITDSLNDTIYTNGQFADAANLGDPGTTNWVNAFRGTGIHGVFLLASDSIALINVEIIAVKALFGNSITEVYRLAGQARPGNQAGHEHFGFLDGISQPAINGFAPPLPGQTPIDPGHILLGETGDSLTRPAWAKDGSFLAFRQLKQLVPEFNQFLANNPINQSGLTAKQGSDLLGARMVGRWKSGAPVDLAPLFDDPVLGADPQRNNNFTFAHPGSDLTSDQSRCPFSAHIRKTAPRADFNPVNVNNHIIRAGIPYGPEVSPKEAASNTTTTERGLAFVSYQSNISQGFRFLQMSWANNPRFIFGKSDPTPGFDPIIGANAGQSRFVSGLDPNDPNHDFTLTTDFVQSRGGEYFFSPSISALKTVFSS
ncbi:hypothetical protein Clacol_007241 [Clathrus columnatus]|uniref:Uncharacterized protein n=1 Tax=Clathrus columnatus TaxID=1419009 RepID=A0AAV5AEC7_9AGAM|nr:hypothetical protein Clacol_007241 [Clathrus columnatus]